MIGEFGRQEDNSSCWWFNLIAH